MPKRKGKKAAKKIIGAGLALILCVGLLPMVSARFRAAPHAVGFLFPADGGEKAAFKNGKEWHSNEYPPDAE